jgi:hypothetical protein
LVDQQKEYSKIIAQQESKDNITMDTLFLIPRENVRAVTTAELASIIKADLFLIRVNLDLDLTIVYPDGKENRKERRKGNKLIHNRGI